MAPLPTITGVVRVALNWHSTGAPVATNVLHFNGVDSLGDIDDLHDALQEFWETDEDGQGAFETISTDAVLGSADYTLLDGETGTVHKVFDNLPSNGTAGNIIPAACCDVSFGTARRGRSYRGRIYIPFVSEAAQHAGILETGPAAAVQGAWSNMIGSALVPGGKALVIASYTLETAEEVISAIVRPTLATQRRRQSRLNTY